MDQEKTKFNLTARTSFIAGIIGGFLVLCTIGFFIMLAVYFGGNNADKNENKQDEVELSAEKFNQCLDSAKYAANVQSDLQLGNTLGVRGTPATFVNGYLISGAVQYAVLKQVVDTVLAGKEPDFDFMKDQDTGKITKVDLPELAGAVWLGNQNAGIIVVEFSDFECPYCASYAPAVKQLLSEYGNKIKFTYRHYPLSFHTNAQKAAEAFECAKEQGKAFEMHDKLFQLANSDKLGVDNYKQAAAELGLK